MVFSLSEPWSTDEIKVKHIISMTACEFKDFRIFSSISSINPDLKGNF